MVAERDATKRVDESLPPPTTAKDPALQEVAALRLENWVSFHVLLAGPGTITAARRGLFSQPLSTIGIQQMPVLMRQWLCVQFVAMEPPPVGSYREGRKPLFVVPLKRVRELVNNDVLHTPLRLLGTVGQRLCPKPLLVSSATAP